MKKKHPLSALYLAAVLIFMYLPVTVVVIYSFNASEIDSVWGGLTLDWYRKLFGNGSMLQALRTSLRVAIWCCPISALIGTLGAVFIPDSRLPAKNVVVDISMIPMMIPEIILGMSFLMFFSLVGIPSGMFTLVVAHCSFCIPYVYVIVRARLNGIDPSINEAARDLGASPARAFFDIIVPMIAPGIASGILLSFAMSLDDVVISFFVNGPTTNTLPLKIYSQLKTGVTPEVNALCTIMLAVTFAVVALSRINVFGKKEKKKGKSL